jgi:hypothetical protein
LVEHTLGKGEVSGSNPLKSSILQGRYENICLCFNGWRVLLLWVVCAAAVGILGCEACANDKVFVGA